MSRHDELLIAIADVRDEAPSEWRDARLRWLLADLDTTMEMERIDQLLTFGSKEEKLEACQ